MGLLYEVKVGDGRLKDAEMFHLHVVEETGYMCLEQALNTHREMNTEKKATS